MMIKPMLIGAACLVLSVEGEPRRAIDGVRLVSPGVMKVTETDASTTTVRYKVAFYRDCRLEILPDRETIFADRFEG